MFGGRKIYVLLLVKIMVKVNGESFVLFKRFWAAARFKKIRPNTFELYKIGNSGERENTFIRDKDYILDEKKGQVKLLPASEIKDFSQSIFWGKDLFNHEGLTNYGNADYTVYADYISDEECEEITYDFKISNTLRKIKEGLPVTLYVFGDSISTGAEASAGQAYFDLAAKHIENKYAAKVNIVNCAKGGENSAEGLKRIDSAFKPCDLAFIAYGMNDQNKTGSSNFVPPQNYYDNLLSIIDYFRQRSSDIDIIVLSCCAPNPKWKYASPNVWEYSDLAKQAAAAKNTAFADVYSLWRRELQSGKIPESLLQNNINHPNNYGHKIYFNALLPLL